MNRQAQAAVLFLIGGAVLRASFTDLHLRYVKAELRPLLIAAGVVLIAAAVATVWYELRERHADRRDPSGGEQREHGGHGHREPRISWLLVLPLFALILVAPPAPGSFEANRAGTALQRPPGFPALPAGDPLRLNVADYAGRAVYDHGRSLGDRHITLTGFITLDPGGTPYLTRMALNCCAADAQAVKIGLTGRTPSAPKPDTWIEVTGTYTGKRTKDPVNGGAIPYIDVTRVKRVPAPSDQYDS